MTRAILFVVTSPNAGREADYNSWYDDVHIPEILEQVPDVRAATRYRRAVGEGETADYCTVYEIEADDPASTPAKLGAAAKAGALQMSDAMSSKTDMSLWIENTPRVSSST